MILSVKNHQKLAETLFYSLFDYMMAETCGAHKLSRRVQSGTRSLALRQWTYCV